MSSVVVQPAPRPQPSRERHDRSRSPRRQRSSSRDRRRRRSRSPENRRERREYKIGSRYWRGGSEERKSPPERRDGRRRDDNKENMSSKRKPDSDSQEPEGSNKKAKSEKKEIDPLLTRTGGAYIPPAKLKLMREQITDKASLAYQRLAWEALKKSIHGLINKVNTSNIKVIVVELLRENVVRGRGLLARSIMQAQAASPTFTHVYAGLVSILNSKFPVIGELILTRLIIQFKRSFRRNDKAQCLSSTRFIAHLVNQKVAHEILPLEIITLLLENPTRDSVEVSISFLKESGQYLSQVSPRGVFAMFEQLRHVLHEGNLDVQVQYMIEVMFQVRKDGFKDHPMILDELDLVEEEDQFTHFLSLEDAKETQDILNVFKHDPAYEEGEAKYASLKKEILGESSGSESGSGDESGDDSDEDEEGGEGGEEGNSGTIVDNTETNLVALRRTIYLTIQSSLDYEECAHKLLKMELKPGQEVELCHMILDCCAQQRTYEKFYRLLAQRFCQINKVYVGPLEQIFRDSYDTIHRLETNKLRNVAKFFAHLLHTDAISWDVLAHIRLNEDDTTSSSRIFIKILFQELGEFMGLHKLNERIKDPTMQTAFEGLFPRDNPRNTRFAINFFTSIGLGGLTDDLREHLKAQSKQRPPPPVAPVAPEMPVMRVERVGDASSEDSDSSDSSSSSSSTTSSSDSTSTSSSSSSSDSGEKSKHKNQKKKRETASKKKATKSKQKREVKQKELRPKQKDTKERHRDSKQKQKQSKEKERTTKHRHQEPRERPSDRERPVRDSRKSDSHARKSRR